MNNQPTGNTMTTQRTKIDKVNVMAGEIVRVQICPDDDPGHFAYLPWLYIQCTINEVVYVLARFATTDADKADRLYQRIYSAGSVNLDLWEKDEFAAMTAEERADDTAAWEHKRNQMEYGSNYQGYRPICQ